ncbi:MAG: hypothetical protein GF401_16000 [Chitinivibrionales bacterium]|nr:hypothetical protein [Chitinivibrionales bacterium]
MGEKVYEILKKYLLLREKLRPYIMRRMELTHLKGIPLMRPLFFDFPHDPIAWEIEDQFMFGPDIVVAPVLEKSAVKRKV